jgi:hypothetical protein
MKTHKQVIQSIQNIAVSLLIMLLIPSISFAVYDLPNNDSDCPANCRRITWSAGSDIWNGGTLPKYNSVTCTGLVTGTADQTAKINTCITNAANDTAVYIPSGTYAVNGSIKLKSRVVLRGAGLGSTILNLGSDGNISATTGQITPSLSYGAHVAGYKISGAPRKGDTNLIISNSGDAAIGDWIAIYSDNNSSLPVDAGGCNWCGENSPFNLQQQIVQITAKSGTAITINKPLYFTLGAAPEFKKYTFGTQRAGIEDLKLNTVADIGANSIIDFANALQCWVNGVETYGTGSSSGSAHVKLRYSYGCEIRNSYFHFGRSSASGANYGIAIMQINSDHKIENNVLRHNRHSIVFEGGGSGCAILYNYMDDNYTDDLTYLGNSRFNHGAHPFMNLFEGNIISSIMADDIWGSSSHFTLFRNWIWGDETGTGVPSYPPGWGYVAINIVSSNTYYNVVGNVLGASGKEAVWSNATVRGGDIYASYNQPMVYSYYTDSATTSINHGNYDYKTKGVAYWEGGADHVLKPSMYYSSAPSFLAGYSWPLLGPDVPGIVNNNPAKDRYEGKSPTGIDAPNSPRNLSIQ